MVELNHRKKIVYTFMEVNNKMISEESQNRPETIFPWSREEIDRLLSYKMYGIDLYSLGPRLYTQLWGTIHIDEMNTIRNVLVSTDCSTLLFVLLYQNKNPLPKEYSFEYFLKFRANFSLLFCTQEEVKELEYNHYEHKNEIFHTLYLTPDIPTNLEYIKTFPMWFPHEVPDLLKGGRSVHRIKYPILGEDDEIMSTSSRWEELKLLNPWENFPHKLTILKL